jgi:glutathione S-transferase
MKLYVSPGACSMSCHIAFEEAGIPVEVQVAKDEAAWKRIGELNPQGAVPILVMNDGKILTQNIAILNFVAENAPQAGLLPAVGSLDRAYAFQWLSFVASDLHPAFGPFFNPALPEEARKAQMEKLDKLLTLVDQHMAGREFVAGSQFSVADAYLFTVFGWTSFLKIPTEKYTNMTAYCGRIAKRPGVIAAMKREGIIK